MLQLVGFALAKQKHRIKPMGYSQATSLLSRFYVVHSYNFRAGSRFQKPCWKL